MMRYKFLGEEERLDRLIEFVRIGTSRVTGSGVWHSVESPRPLSNREVVLLQTKDPTQIHISLLGTHLNGTE